MFCVLYLSHVIKAMRPVGIIRRVDSRITAVSRLLYGMPHAGQAMELMEPMT